MKLLLLLFFLMVQFINSEGIIQYPDTEKRPEIFKFHGKELADNYSWLEKSENVDVTKWVETQEEYTSEILKNSKHMEYLTKRFSKLWKYDDEGNEKKVFKGERVFYWKKKKDDNYKVIYTKSNDTAKEKIILNPNTWTDKKTLQYNVPTCDGKLLAYGVSQAGDEAPVLFIKNVETGEIYKDRVKGRKQYLNAWLPDNSGFYYSCNPEEGDVPEGEEFYWGKVYLHILGTDSKNDTFIYGDDKIKERFHGVGITEDNKYLIYYKSSFYKNDVSFKELGSNDEPTIITEGLDARYGVDIYEGKIFITTDKDAPNQQVFVTTVDKPDKKNWKLFLTEQKDKLKYISFVSGKIYAVYSHNVHDVIKIYNIDGKYLRDLKLPTLGSASVWGYWSKEDIYVSFSSFTYPTTAFKYDFEENKLSVYKELPMKIDVSDYQAEQVWYDSKDGTPISMFLITRKDLIKDGNNPVYLTGYGGFNISQIPYFSSFYPVFLELGGMIAIPNLRGGGEYGEEWHKAGMKKNKQNVYDDFIYAAEWLIDNRYTSNKKLAISGGSNGGLLVGAALVQRPDLFKAVLCSVPLLDMVRYHEFGLANIWEKEYGNSEDPEMFEYLLKTSPYHNVNKVNYPATLITCGENDARVDPLHAKKMVAILQENNTANTPIMLRVNRDSGHGGGVTIDSQIRQFSESKAFIMKQLGMSYEKQ